MDFKQGKTFLFIKCNRTMSLFARSFVLVACGNTSLTRTFSLIILTRVKSECVTSMLIYVNIYRSLETAYPDIDLEVEDS